MRVFPYGEGFCDGRGWQVVTGTCLLDIDRGTSQQAESRTVPRSRLSVCVCEAWFWNYYCCRERWRYVLDAQQDLQRKNIAEGSDIKVDKRHFSVSWTLTLFNPPARARYRNRTKLLKVLRGASLKRLSPPKLNNPIDAFCCHATYCTHDAIILRFNVWAVKLRSSMWSSAFASSPMALPRRLYGPASIDQPPPASLGRAVSARHLWFCHFSVCVAPVGHQDTPGSIFSPPSQ